MVVLSWGSGSSRRGPLYPMVLLLLSGGESAVVGDRGGTPRLGEVIVAAGCSAGSGADSPTEYVAACGPVSSWRPLLVAGGGVGKLADDSDEDREGRASPKARPLGRAGL